MFVKNNSLPRKPILDLFGFMCVCVCGGGGPQVGMWGVWGVCVGAQNERLIQAYKENENAIQNWKIYHLKQLIFFLFFQNTHEERENYLSWKILHKRGK